RRQESGVSPPWLRHAGQGSQLPAMSWLAGVVLLLAFAALYLLTLDNGLRPGELQGGDLITHQYAQVQGRPSNAPGYPLYTMGGWLWFRLGRLFLGPRTNPIALLSSYSTLWALLALGLLYALILEVTARRAGRGNWPVAGLVTAFYGVTYFFWYYAVTTEQYTSSVAWTLAVIWLAFRWERERRDGYLLAIAFLAGVALAHQLTLPIILPPVLWWALRSQPGLARRPRLIAVAVALGLLPLLSYAYVYVAGARHPEWRGAGAWASAWEWFWAFISTSQGRAELTWSGTLFFTAEFPALIWREMTVPGLIAGLFGWATLGRRPALALSAAFILYLALCWVDRLGNWYQVIMPLYALLAVGIAAGAEYGMRNANRKSQIAFDVSRLTFDVSRLTRFLILGCLGALLVYRAALSYPAANAHNRPDDAGLAPGWAMLADDPPAGAAILGTLPESAALNYLTVVWGQRPDLRPVTSEQAQALLAQGAPVVVTQAALPLVAQEVTLDAHYSALGRTLIRITAAPGRSLPAGLQPWTHDFDATLRLAGGKVYRDAATGETVALLAWEARGKPVADWAVSVRLTQQGREIAQVDHQHPVFGAYPTSRWSPGEVVGDAYPVTLPPGVAPDGLTVILYRRAPDGGFVNLDVARWTLP
ncbi:MAG: hypothetical protein QG637_1822, partial [Chloroflexota bacterium]|nr:hypothetical protein [Chloroflexota bacterium]